MIAAVSGHHVYDDAALFVSEAGILLAKEKDKLEGPGGVLTPAAAFRLHLIEKLRDRGVQFDILQSCVLKGSPSS